MSHIIPFKQGNAVGPLPPADLATLLQAWHEATERLQKTHYTLQAEVKRLTDELETKNRQLARKNRLADLGQMASHVAHEVRNSLVPLTLYLSLLRRRVSDDAGAVDIADKVKAGLTALDSTVNDLLHFTADRPPQYSVFPLAELVGEVIDWIEPQLVAQNVATEMHVTQSLCVRADRDMLRRAMLNLVLNALDVMPEGGELVFTAAATAGHIELEIADSGPGLERNARDRIFEPFYTTKSTGTGLGLAIVQRIAEVHGGAVAATNCVEGGAAFTIRIPHRAREAAA